MGNSINRRNFLRLSLLGSGGLLVGLQFAGCESKGSEMPVNIDELDFTAFNAYIEMAKTGHVIIYSPNPEIGQGIKTAMPMIVAEELDVPWKMVTVKQAPLSNDFNRQVAGGSQSIRQNFPTLRNAGATVKLMLMTAAAQQWKVDVSECTAEDAIIKNAKGDQLKYADVLEAAAKLEIPEEAPLKESKDFKLIGQPILNVDIDDIITGKPIFGIDYKEEGMKYASVIIPPFGAELDSFDATEALKMNGIEQVISFDNKVGIIGKNTWSVFKAKDTVKVKWKNIKSDQDTKIIDQKMDKALLGKGEKIVSTGQYSKAIKSADKVISKTFSSPYLPHATLEPLCFFADVKENSARLIGPTQVPRNSAKTVAEDLGIPEENITVEMTRMGGGFGRRLSTDFTLESAQISAKIKAPVKLVHKREDDMDSGMFRPKVKYKLTAGMKNNKLDSLEIKEAITQKSGLRPWNANFFPGGTVDHYHTTSEHIETDISTLWWRAPITNFLGFSTGSFLDDVAESLNKDCIEFHQEILDAATGKKLPYAPKRMKAVIDLVKEKSNWGKTDAIQGFACYFSHNTYVAEVCEIEMKDGKAIPTKVVAAVDCGIVINISGAKAQVEGSILDALGHSRNSEISIIKGKVQEQNFDQYALGRMMQTPIVETHFVDTNEAPTGLGEPAYPPAAAAFANAVKKATGKRWTAHPFLG
ncbi:xanthine dehydrogenase family protein molybdopterin-binding subunit [Flammeovirga sp. MY04]|uniref:xanthine dehydrogenase family protein molybdopterin-binding subunit n=1 Tax=Flammeovirga sp. MY04 TaxID=1191459 RepID=UPI0008060EE6|nr:molybdopterin cofactor-binding domain-containing protein [Flammeovirga sp. MY04]ANQ52407.1 xanthine dehydrogenase family protein molybdopterin-binding subunit [Flammeovirga sp. MY04]